MSRASRGWVALLLAGAGAAAAAPGNTSRPSPRSDRVDFHAGMLQAGGAGAPDPRAPSPAIGRIAAERVARKNARAHLVQLALGLPAGGRESVSQRCDVACAARLAAVIEAEAEDLDVRYFSDGAVKLSARVPLEVVRGVLDPRAPGDLPAWTDAAPSALVVDAGGLDAAAGIAPRLHAGSVTVTGPVLYLPNLAAATADPRLGPRPLQVKATAADGADLTLDAAAADQLTAAGRAGALIIIIGTELVR